MPKNPATLRLQSTAYRIASNFSGNKMLNFLSIQFSINIFKNGLTFKIFNFCGSYCMIRLFSYHTQKAHFQCRKGSAGETGLMRAFNIIILYHQLCCAWIKIYREVTWRTAVLVSVRLVILHAVSIM